MVADPEQERGVGVGVGISIGMEPNGEAVAVVTSTSTSATPAPAENVVVEVARMETSNANSAENGGRMRGRRRHGRREVATWTLHARREMRDDFIGQITTELERIRGDENAVSARRCATRFESHVLERSPSEEEYRRRLEQHLASLRRQSVRARPIIASSPVDASHAPAEAQAPVHARAHSRGHGHPRARVARRSSRRLSAAELAARDDAYFARLRLMRATYRDDVAIVYRELRRVNAVILSSSTARQQQHAEATTNLGEFLKNLLKVIHLLEQQPDEMHGIIPQRKRTLGYLDVVETHIQRKVLPMLHRLRHTYSTLLRPIVLNYLRSNARALRRL